MKLKKVCPHCGESKWRKRDFYPHVGWCKECILKRNREQYNRTKKKHDGIVRGADGRIYDHQGYAKRLYWGEQKIADFKRLYPFMKNDELALKFDCSSRTVVRRAHEMGLKKDAVWLRNMTMKHCEKMNMSNKIFGNRADLTNFLAAGARYGFQKGRKRNETPEQARARMLKAWETRRRNMAMITI